MSVPAPVLMILFLVSTEPIRPGSINFSNLALVLIFISPPPFFILCRMIAPRGALPAESEHWMLVDRLPDHRLYDVPMFYELAISNPEDVDDGPFKDVRFDYPESEFVELSA
jgi:hypothetical protein